MRAAKVDQHLSETEDSLASHDPESLTAEKKKPRSAVYDNEPFVCGYLIGNTLYSERDPDKIPAGAKIVISDPKWKRFGG